MVNWKRPENVPFPSIWRSFDRKGKDGIVRKYWVQDLTPEYEETFVNNMITVFLKDEPLCKYSKFSESPQAVEEFKNMWINAIKQKLSVICLTKDINGKEQFVGGNMTCISEKDVESTYNENCTQFHKVMSAVIYATTLKDTYKELNVNEYLTAYGLYVLPEFRGQGIGTEILKTRRELCLAVGLKASATIFTSIVSQKNAQQAGFQDFVEINYDDLEKINPLWHFPGISSFTKSIKNMCVKYE